MGKKKYFCDFCLRFFNDDRNTRLKHLNSVAHLKAKTEHYDLFRDPEIILKENSFKKPCRRFQSDGYCHFGTSCTYSHYSPFDLDILRQEVEKIKREKYNIKLLSADAFLQKFDEIMLENQAKNRISTWSHELPNILPMTVSLPVSLQPFDVKIYSNIEVNDWG